MVEVVKLVDTQRSERCERKLVGVQLSSSALSVNGAWCNGNIYDSGSYDSEFESRCSESLKSQYMISELRSYLVLWAYGIAVTHVHGMDESGVRLPVGPQR